MNTEGCTNEEAFTIKASMESSLNIPVLLPIQTGVAPLIPVLKSLLQ